MQKSAEECIQQWQEGIDPEGNFKLLYDSFSVSVHELFLRRGIPEAEAEELVQVTFLNVYRGLADFRHEASPRTWILRIALNLYKNWLRDRKRNKRDGQEVGVEEVGEDGFAPTSAADPSRAWQSAPALEAVLVEEEIRHLRDAVAQLSPPLQWVVLLRLQERTNEEIATLLKIPLGTVKSRKNAADAKLRKLLGERYSHLGLEESGL